MQGVSCSLNVSCDFQKCQASCQTDNVNHSPASRRPSIHNGEHTIHKGGRIRTMTLLESYYSILTGEKITLPIMHGALGRNKEHNAAFSSVTISPCWERCVQTPVFACYLLGRQVLHGFPFYGNAVNVKRSKQSRTQATLKERKQDISQNGEVLTGFYKLQCL